MVDITEVIRLLDLKTYLLTVVLACGAGLEMHCPRYEWIAQSHNRTDAIALL